VTTPEREAFARMLVERETITEDSLKQAREEESRTGGRLEEVIVRLGLARAESVYEVLADCLGVPYLRLSSRRLDAELISSVPARFVVHYNFMPVDEQDGSLVIAVTNPRDTHLLDELQLALKRRVKPVLATAEEIAQATKQYYGIGADTVERMLSNGDRPSQTVDLESRASEVLDDKTVDASIIKFVNEIILDAIKMDATDIHIEPFEKRSRVRYRIDGVLHEVSVPQSIKEFHASIVSRIKILANLNIAERRLPQDGKIRATLGGHEFDLRVSILPTPHGEAVNIRVLSRETMFLTLTQLGFSDRDQTVFEDLISKPHGIVLVTGPTGSGKTTTLYASLAKLNSAERKVITIEDPIEYQLEGIVQMEVQPRIGFDFARGLRSILRHDPDIILVGEIRDFETAESAIRAALTGHLVFSTLHTNDAAGAITRLIDMGVEPFLVASSVIGCVAQRLVRLICPKCKEEFVPEPRMFKEMGVSPEEGARHTYYRGAGCEECKHTGYRGRIAVYEILPMSTPIRELTVERAATNVIRRKGQSLGTRLLRDDGWERVKAGMTTFEDVLRVCMEEDFLDDLIAPEAEDAAV